MYEAVFMAATGLVNQQRRLDTIADNVANVNTVGFKAARLDFKDALYTANSLGPLGSPEENHQKGHGVMSASADRIYQEGSIMTSGEPLDFAIEGDGFFELENQSGQSVYTRAGNFYLGGVEADGNQYLVNARGYYVHDMNGQRIAVPLGTHVTVCDEQGLIEFVGADESQFVQLGIFSFANPTGLDALGGSNFAESAASGGRERAEGYTVHQGALESSNVSLADEMTRMIRAQRAFSLASRALKTADDMEGIANNLRR